ncbi:MAG TPA: transporter substrate-binding domain-containing protein [Gammaproteobacteria bacterium]|nr:transporter substrate-binding domain-containing protein [Gammaproteobacteria bacterium]
MKYPGRLLAAIAAVSFFALSVVIPTNAWAGSSTPVLDRIQKSGKLVIGTSANMPLMSEQLETGEIAGFDIDMATALAESMGVKLEVKVIPFDKLIPALESGKVDAVFSNMTMTVERNMHVAFAGPYFVSGKCLITKEEEMAKKSDAKELKAEDLSIAVVKGSTSELFVRELLPQLKRIAVSDVDKGTNMVEKGKAKAMMTDFPICLSVMKRYPDKGFQSVVSLLTYEPIGIALPANDPLFVNLAENFIQRADGVGLTEELALKWFGDAILSIIEQEQKKEAGKNGK